MRMRAGSFVAIPLLAAGAAACGDAGAGGDGGSAVARWSLAPQPEVEIGVVEGEEPYLLHDVAGAVELEDGRIVVLNAGSHEVRIYDGEGRHLRSLGREGDGPGEFRGPARLRHVGGDTVEVVDEELRRTTRLTLDGEVVGVEDLPAPTEQPFPAETWIYGRTWVDGGVPGRRGGIARALAALPSADTAAPYRYAKVSGDGRLWITDRLPPWPEGARWEIRGPGGSLVAEMETPPAFFPLRIAGGRVLGLRTDSLDVQRVAVHAIETPEGSSAGPGPAGLLAPGSDDPVQTGSLSMEALGTLRGAVRMMASHQEMHFARSAQEGGREAATYASSVAALDDPQVGRFEAPEGARVEILSAGTRHWIAVATHEATRTRCVYGAGVPRMVGLPPGRALCWQEVPPTHETSETS